VLHAGHQIDKVAAGRFRRRFVKLPEPEVDGVRPPPGHLGLGRRDRRVGGEPAHQRCAVVIWAGFPTALIPAEWEGMTTGQRLRPLQRDYRPLLAAALAIRAWAGAFAGDGEQAQTLCDQATELVDKLSDQELARRLNALAHLASADSYLDRFPAATRHAQRALEIGRATGQGDLFPLVVIMLGG
jgi:hypothetical protein